MGSNYHGRGSKAKSRRSSHRLDYESPSNRNRKEREQRGDNNMYLHSSNNHHSNEYKHDPPYIVSKSRRKKNGHNRFHSDGNILHDQPKMNENHHSNHSSNHKPHPHPHRKPPLIRRHPPSPNNSSNNSSNHSNHSNHNNAHKQKKLSSKQKLKKHESTPQAPKLPLAPNSSNLPPLPATPLSQKRHSTPRNMTPKNELNNDYNQWLLICFKNSIIDSLMELLHNDELRVYVFDDTMIAHHMIGNDILSAIEYLFECQFAFMSNGSAYLDFNGFAAGMRKCNIHFETPEIAIPLIFEQLVGINTGNKGDKNTKGKKKKSKIDYNHVFIAEDTFVEWMMNYIRIHVNGGIKTKKHHGPNQFDERIDKLFNVLQVIYNESKYNKYMQQQDKMKSNKKKKRKSASPNVINSNNMSKGNDGMTTSNNKTKGDKKASIINPFEVESLYASSPSMNQQRQINFKSLGLPPRQKFNEYHQNHHISHSNKKSIQSAFGPAHNKYYDSNSPSIHSLHAQSTINHQTSNNNHYKSVKPMRNTNHNHNNSHVLYKYKPRKNRSNHDNDNDDPYYTEY
mmetsp:Transcript_70229/g.63029  ORF Transcript_70229/g.63029 Transcript_70229/m.63029 type:complete len:566 (+) Transcript_70229:1-1698(+)